MIRLHGGRWTVNGFHNDLNDKYGYPSKVVSVYVE